MFHLNAYESIVLHITQYQRNSEYITRIVEPTPPELEAPRYLFCHLLSGVASSCSCSVEFGMKATLPFDNVMVLKVCHKNYVRTEVGLQHWVFWGHPRIQF